MTFIVATAAPSISAPSVSLINVTPTSITVSLDSPAVGPAPISFYSVQLFNTATNALIESFSVAPTSFPFLIPGLTNGTAYTVTVTGIEATQNIYASPQILRQITTGSTASPPSQVTGLTATATGQTTIALSWTADPTATSYTITRTGGLSPSGTTISGPGAAIVDANGNTWTLGTGVGGPNYSVYINGGLASVSYSVTLLLYYNAIIYQETASNAWFSWNGSSWTAVAGDPRGTAPGVPAIAAAVGANTQSFNSTTLANTTGSLFAAQGFYGAGTQPTSAWTQNSDGSLTIKGSSASYGFNLNVITAAYIGPGNASYPDWFKGIAFGTPPGGATYFKMVWTANPTSAYSDNPGAPIWFSPIERLVSSGVTSFPGAIYNQGGNAWWVEVDGEEFFYNTTNTSKGNTCINWTGTGSGNSIQNNQAASNVQINAAGGSFTNQQIDEFVWIAATSSSPGSWTQYHNGTQVGVPTPWNQYNSANYPGTFNSGGAAPGSAMSIMDMQHLCILSGAKNNSATYKIITLECYQSSTSANLVYT
jgi:hypothetical protein